MTDKISLKRTGIVAVTGAVVVAGIQAAWAVDLARPAHERASEPRRVPDAAERELLFRQFRDWLRTKGYKTIQLRVKKLPAEAGLRLILQQ